MQYALLYYHDPDRTAPTEGEVAEWIAFDEEVKADGVFLYEAGLQSQQTASIVQTRNGTTTVEPSPVAATGEVIAGFYTWMFRVPTRRRTGPSASQLRNTAKLKCARSSSSRANEERTHGPITSYCDPPHPR